MDNTKKILVAVTNHDRLLDRRPTGYWLSEIAHFAILAHGLGHTLDFISPRGGPSPMDPSSNEDYLLQDTIVKSSLSRLYHTKKPNEVRPQDYEGIYFPGGHGPLWDIAADKDIATIAAKIYERGGIVAAVCHGSAGLLPIILSDGTYLIAGKTVTGFSNMEEMLVRKKKAVPYLLEDELKKKSHYTRGLPFFPHIEIDGKLITGQNPQSTKQLTNAVFNKLRGIR